jgi:Leucine-rich repeat (LRR) protein
MPKLRKLHLRKNKIINLENQLNDLPSLEYINLREN